MYLFADYRFIYILICYHVCTHLFKGIGIIHQLFMILVAFFLYCNCTANIKVVLCYLDHNVVYM